MPWGNPIVGGQGVLIRDSIRSPDYAAGVSGWSINRDGTAEFNDVTIRGQLIANGGNVVVDDDGLLVQTTSTSYVQITDYFGDAAILLSPEPLDPGTYPLPANLINPAVLNASTSDIAGTGRVFLTIDSPRLPNGPNTDAARLVLAGANTAGGRASARIEPSSGTDIDIDLKGAVYIGDSAIDCGRGLFARSSAAGNSAALPNGFTTALQLTADFEASRAYRVVMGGRYLCSAVNMAPNAALSSNIGTTLCNFGKVSCPTIANYTIPSGGQDVFTTGGSVLTRTLDQRISSDTVGQNVTVIGPRWMEVYDIGPASAFPNAVVLV